MSLWVPPRVSRELKDSTQQHRADLRDQMRFQTHVCNLWNGELAKIDPYLRLAQAKEEARLPGVLPGYYHLVRLNPEAPPWVQPLTGPQGEFIEPTSRMLDDLRASDLQSARAMAARKAREEEAERQKRRDREREDEDRQTEIHERLLAATRASVSMDRSVPWTQTAEAKRDR